MRAAANADDKLRRSSHVCRRRRRRVGESPPWVITGVAVVESTKQLNLPPR